jgi:hypothetical protein
MKDVKLSYKPSAFRVPTQDAPPPSGWFVQYVSGMEEYTEIRPGFWLTDWIADSQGDICFSFDSGTHTPFDTRADANAVSNAIRERMGIETRVVKIGVSE